MVIKFGILPFDEPKEISIGVEQPKKLTDFNCDEEADFRSVAPELMSKVIESANSEKFRLYMEGGKRKLCYQVNLSKESHDFLEKEILDDLNLLHNRKSMIK